MQNSHDKLDIIFFGRGLSEVDGQAVAMAAQKFIIDRDDSISSGAGCRGRCVSDGFPIYGGGGGGGGLRGGVGGRAALV